VCLLWVYDLYFIFIMLYTSEIETQLKCNKIENAEASREIEKTKAYDFQNM
jgi:hypothetical protein